MPAGGSGWLALSFVFGASRADTECAEDPWEGNEDIAEEDLAEFLSHHLRLKDAIRVPSDPIVAALQKCRARCAALPAPPYAEFDAYRCVVGDAAMAPYIDGQFYPAHVDSVDWTLGIATVNWDDGDVLYRAVPLQHLQALTGQDKAEQRPSIGSLSVASTSADLSTGSLGPPSTGSSTSASTARPSIESLGHAAAVDPVATLAFTEPFAEEGGALEDAWEVEFMLRSALDAKGPFAELPKRNGELFAELSEALAPEAPEAASETPRSRGPSDVGIFGHHVLLGGYL